MCGFQNFDSIHIRPTRRFPDFVAARINMSVTGYNDTGNRALIIFRQRLGHAYRGFAGAAHESSSRSGRR